MRGEVGVAAGFAFDGPQAAAEFLFGGQGDLAGAALCVEGKACGQVI